MFGIIAYVFMSKISKVFISFLAVVMCFAMLTPMAFADAPYEGNHQGSITVSVHDIVADSPLRNAAIQLEDITAGREHNYGTKTTSSNGQVTWSNLSSGWYRITQTAVPNGYILNSEEIVRYFDTEQQKLMPVEIKNRSKVALYIYRIDPATQTGLKGASYQVTDSTGALVGQGVTDENGYFVIPHIGAGDYTITEVNAPNGYNRTSAPQKLTVVETETEPYVKVFNGSEKSSITIFNYDYQ